MFHSVNFKLTDTEMKDNFRAMKTLLGDPKHLKNDAKAMQAVKRIEKVTHNHRHGIYNKLLK